MVQKKTKKIIKLKKIYIFHILPSITQKGVQKTFRSALKWVVFSLVFSKFNKKIISNALILVLRLQNIWSQNCTLM